MATLPTGIRAFWLGARADIPDGWEADNTKGTFYFSGAIDAGGSGGNVSHLHPIPDHDHPGVAHKHAISGSTVTGITTNVSGIVSVMLYSNPQHGHVAQDSNETTINYQDATGLSTDATSGHDPPFIEAIIIKPTDASQQLPVSAVGLWDDATTPNGYQFANGGNGSPDMRNRFIRGAPALADGGGTGGTSTHSHTDTAGHTQVPDDHEHAQLDLVGRSDNELEVGEDTGSGIRAADSRHHEFILDSKVLADVSTDSVPVSARTNSPDYVRLSAMQNQSGDEDLTPGIILMYDDAIGTLPPDWLVCDGTKGTQNTVDKQILVAAVPGDIGDTGGESIHPHGGASHGHLHTGPHDHVETVVGLVGGENSPSGNAVLNVRSHPAHTWTVTGTTPTMQNTVANAQPADGRLPFKDMVFVKHAPPTVHIKGGWLKGGKFAA